MPRYYIPAFEIDAIEEIRESYDGAMKEARLTNGWDLRIPAYVVPEKLLEPYADLEDGYYTMSGVKFTLKRCTTNEGRVVWDYWNGERWTPTGLIADVEENNPDYRDRLNYLGGS